MNRKVFINYQNIYSIEEFLDALSEINRELTKEIAMIKAEINKIDNCFDGFDHESSLHIPTRTSEDNHKIVNFSINIDQRNTIKKEIPKLRKDIREVWDYKREQDKIRVNSIVFTSGLNDRVCLSGEWDFGTWREDFNQNNSQNKNIYTDFSFSRYTFWFDESGTYDSVYKTMLC